MAPLPSDDLGEWGESQFKALCAAGGLVANKAERDKLGWDFIVQLPPSDTSDEPLDRRPAGLSCRIQVKAGFVAEGVATAVKLSAAERLAKDIGPSFIAILGATPGVGDEDPQLTSLHLVHMMDENLGRILKRLREAEADDQSKPLAEQRIYFTGPAAGRSLSPNGKALRRALEDACGDDADAYVAAKSGQLKSLGYETGRYQLKATIRATDMDEIVEIFLGLRSTEMTDLTTRDVRFDVPIPIGELMDLDSAKATVTPLPTGQCTVRVRGAALRPPATFEADVFLPPFPDLAPEHQRMLIKADGFGLDLRPGGLTLSFDAKALDEGARSLDAWRQLLTLFKIVTEPEIEFDIQGHADGAPHAVIPLHQPLPGTAPSWTDPMITLVEEYEALLRLAGVDGGVVTLNGLFESREAIRAAYGKLLAARDPAPFTMTSQAVLEDPSRPAPDLEVLQIDYVLVADRCLAYACRVIFRGEAATDGLVWRQVDHRPLKVVPIVGTDEPFAAFAETMKVQTGIANLMIRQTSEADDADPDA